MHYPGQGGLCQAAGIDTGVVAQVKFGTQLTVSGEYKFGGSSAKKQAGLDPIIVGCMLIADNPHK